MPNKTPTPGTKKKTARNKKRISVKEKLFAEFMVYEKMGRFADAVEQYREVLRLDPDHPQQKGVRAKIAELRAKLSAPGPGGGRD